VARATVHRAPKLWPSENTTSRQLTEEGYSQQSAQNSSRPSRAREAPEPVAGRPGLCDVGQKLYLCDLRAPAGSNGLCPSNHL
jgi:hypothetical protein